MGTFYWPLTVIGADGNSEETVEALVDTGASYTSLPTSMPRRLGIVPQRTIEFELADGRIVEDEIGFAVVQINGVRAPTIVVFADDGAPALMGAHALEGVTMVADPVSKRLAPTRVLMMGLEG